MNDQDTHKPTRKVTAATAGAACGTLIIGLAVWLGADQPPAGIEGALGTVLAFVAGYVVRDS